MKVLIIDNYDSFTFNLYQEIGKILVKRHAQFVLDVVRNDQMTLSEIKKRKYGRIVISPGPGDPSDKAYFGVCADVITKLGQTTPILGVCLGMQGMAHYFGGKVIRAKVPMHGKTSVIVHDGKGVFSSLPQNLEVMRYHSLVTDPLSLPALLEITAAVRDDKENLEFRVPHFVKTSRGRQNSELKKKEIEVMGLRHKTFPVEGIQFHPESFATEAGERMLENFLSQKGGTR